MESNDLFDWYLARLRKLAWVDETAQRPTPVTLVQTDKQLLQQLVVKAADSFATRKRKFLDASNSDTASASLLIAITVAGFCLLLWGLV